LRVFGGRSRVLRHGCEYDVAVAWERTCQKIISRIESYSVELNNIQPQCILLVLLLHTGLCFFHLRLLQLLLQQKIPF
jgi:hypothetical protein